MPDDKVIDLEFADMDEIAREVASRHVGAVILTMEESKRTKKGEQPAYELRIRSTNTHGAIGVLLTMAQNANAHLFMQALNKEGPAKA